jgi:hypothetical protein
MPVLSWLTRRTATTNTPFRSRLGVEVLEGRVQLSAINPLLVSSPPVADSRIIPNSPPQIVNFTAEQIGNGLFVFTGHVIDESPAGLTVTFGGGVPTIAGQTTLTDANGDFSYTIRLKTDGTDSGTVSAATVDPLGAPSNVALVDVSPTP